MQLFVVSVLTVLDHLWFIYFCLLFALFVIFKGEHWSFLGHATTTEHCSVHVYAGIDGCVMVMVVMTKIRIYISYCLSILCSQIWYWFEIKPRYKYISELKSDTHTTRLQLSDCSSFPFVSFFLVAQCSWWVRYGKRIQAKRQSHQGNNPWVNVSGWSVIQRYSYRPSTGPHCSYGNADKPRDLESSWSCCAGLPCMQPRPLGPLHHQLSEPFWHLTSALLWQVVESQPIGPSARSSDHTPWWDTGREWGRWGEASEQL